MVPYDDDLRDPDPVVFERDAATIKLTGPNGEVAESIELPPVAKRRSEVSPAWLALHEAEQNKPATGEETQMIDDDNMDMDKLKARFPSENEATLALLAVGAVLPDEPERPEEIQAALVEIEKARE